MELNPRHPLVKELRSRVEADESDTAATELAMVLFETATLRSGYGLKDTAAFAERVEKMMRRSLGVSLDEKVCCCTVPDSLLVHFYQREMKARHQNQKFVIGQVDRLELDNPVFLMLQRNPGRSLLTVPSRSSDDKYCMLLPSCISLMAWLILNGQLLNIR